MDSKLNPPGCLGNDVTKVWELRCDNYSLVVRKILNAERPTYACTVIMCHDNSAVKVTSFANDLMTAKDNCHSILSALGPLKSILELVDSI